MNKGICAPPATECLPGLLSTTKGNLRSYGNEVLLFEVATDPISGAKPGGSVHAAQKPEVSVAAT